MKTSNKLLLGIFSIIILLTTIVQLMVYAKYKRGEYVTFNRDDYYDHVKINVPPTKFVSLIALGSCDLINSDTPRIEMREGRSGTLSYKVVNDTLIINGDSTLTNNAMAGGTRNRQNVKLYLPVSVQIQTAFCNVYAKGALDSAHAPSYTVTLTKNSSFGISWADNKTTYFNQLLINGGFANIDLDDHAIINDLNLSMAHSSLDSKNALVKKMTLNYDDNSTIALSGRNLKALK
ncbi:hypothetical protein A3860_24400 [Niastella vici]|uniref:Uncharacterized protein n=1 Tax=Niastella vici TaxID=1703345 RepID=A0A1V9FZ15_9BACT|nr:hypothetical protein [Niastella vici]OQP63486.1 hypothetical protein A3860_24400 [Niastella vici]